MVNRGKSRLRRGGLALLLGLLTTSAHAAPLPVVASFSILGDMVRAVGGDAVAVTTLVGPDGDTHTYEPTPRDAIAVAKTKAVFVNGLGFDGWMNRVVAASGTTGEVVVATDGIAAGTMVDAEAGGRTITDPHAWQDLGNGLIYVRNITAALTRLRPDQAAAITARAAAYTAQLQALDRDVRVQIAAVPVAQRVIVTSHDAFGYFGRAYGVRFLAPEGVSTEAEPSAAAIAQLNRQIGSLRVHTLFFETMTGDRFIRQIARDAHAAVGGALYSDALSGADGPAGTYSEMFRHNVPLLVAAMQGNG